MVVKCKNAREPMEPIVDFPAHQVNTRVLKADKIVGAYASN